MKRNRIEMVRIDSGRIWMAFVLLLFIVHRSAFIVVFSAAPARQEDYSKIRPVIPGEPVTPPITVEAIPPTTAPLTLPQAKQPRRAPAPEDLDLATTRPVAPARPVRRAPPRKTPAKVGPVGPVGRVGPVGQERRPRDMAVPPVLPPDDIFSTSPATRVEERVAVRKDETTTRPINPHWKENLCGTCHPQGADGQINPKALVDPNPRANCDRCHPYGTLRTTHHPYDIRPTERTPVPPEWPLENNLIGCLTCHAIMIQCVGTLKDRWRNPPFLRREPTETNEDFCLKCHKEQVFATSSPHDQLDENGSIRPGVCQYCHLRQPETKGPNVAATKALKAPVVELCSNCHGNFPHPVGVPHIVPIPNPMLQRMVACEVQAEYIISVQELQRYMKDVRRLPRAFPVTPRTHMSTCNTCHNPHERGVLPPENPLSRGAETDAVRNYRLRMPQEEICLCCHQM